MLAELVLHTRYLVTRRVGWHDERSDATLAGLRVGDGEDDDHTGVLPGRNELLAAVEYVVVAIQARTGLQAAGVGTRLGFGQREGPDHRTAGQRCEELLLLLLGAKFEYGHATHRVVHAHDGRAGTIACGDLFQGQGICHVPRIAAAVLLRHQHAEQAQGSHLVNGFAREAMRLVPLLGERP